MIQFENQTLLSLFAQCREANPDREMLLYNQGSKKVSISCAGWFRRSRIWASALVDNDLASGARIAMLCRTRPEWCILDMAIMMAGAVSVPAFQNEPAIRFLETVKHSGAEVVVVENPVQAAVLLEHREQMTSVKRLIVLDGEGTRPSGDTLMLKDVQSEAPEGWIWGREQLQDVGETHLERYGNELDRRLKEARPDTVVSIVYTPGTEGQPKAVVLSHGNFVTAGSAIVESLELGPDDLQLLYLPLAHTYGRLCLYTSLISKGPIAFARSYGNFLEDTILWNPTFFCSIPRLFEKVHEEMAREDVEQGSLQRMVSSWARDGEKGGLLQGLKRKMADTLVYSRLRERFGKRLRFAISGGAPLRPDVTQFFAENGLEILEGYGLAETAAAVAINRPAANCIGTVGRPQQCAEIRVNTDGELAVRGGNVCLGYWSDDGSIKPATQDDGWFLTGDIVSVDEEGFISIVDRRRNIILTATGKVIPPAPIVEAIRGEPLIDQVVLCGDGHPFITALITIDAEALARFASDSGIEGDCEFLMRHPMVYRVVEKKVEEVNRDLAPYERIRKFAILTEELTAEEGDVTPTLCLRRRKIAEKYRALLESFYSERY
jgi:long-chain acyl-CoA synthetase